MRSGKQTGLRLVLMGKPGAGKGTQAEKLAGDFGLPHLSSGAMLRADIREGTRLGKKVKEYVLKGEIGPEELITEAILGYIERNGLGDRFVLDGFPRTIFQAAELDRKYSPHLCILLEITDSEAESRLSGRYTCGRCGKVYNLDYSPPETPGVCGRCGGKPARRKDDTPPAIRKRLQIFESEARPVIRHYESGSRLERVDASLPTARVLQIISSLIEKEE